MAFYGVLIALVALIPASISAFVDASQFAGRGPNPSVPPATSSSQPSGSQPTQSAAPSTPAAKEDQGSCWATLEEEVDCLEPHRYQSLSGACTPQGLVTFLGGRPDLDVPLDKVVKQSEQCFMDHGRNVEGDARNAFASARGDAWRRCVDGDTASLVPCNQQHTGEYVATGLTTLADQPACEAAVEEYLNQQLDQLPELRAGPINGVNRTADPARCLIEVRGSQPLTASVRQLGVNPVPIQR